MRTQTMLNTYRASKSRARLNSGLRLALVPTMALAATLLASASHAQVMQITSAQLTPTSTANFTDPVGLVANPYQVAASGSTITLTFTNNGASSTFSRINQQGIGAGQGDNFGGDFAPGTHLLRNPGTGSGAGSALTVAFNAGVNALGFNYEPNANFAMGAANFTFTVFQGASSTVFTSPPIPIATNNDYEDGSAPFFGVRAMDGSNSITSIQIFATAAPGSTTTTPDDFVISPIQLGVRATAVPEPGVLALLAGAILPMGLLVARRRPR